MQTAHLCRLTLQYSLCLRFFTLSPRLRLEAHRIT